MGNLSLMNIESPITWNGTNNTNFTPVKVKWRQMVSGTHYYRIRCAANEGYTPANFKEFYIVLGATSTSPDWIYTLDFSVQGFQTMKQDGAMQSENPGDWFTSTAGTGGDSTSDRIYVRAYLQSSTSIHFTSYEESSEYVQVYVMLGENVFVPTWSSPTWADALYSQLPGIPTLTGSDQKGVQGISRLTFTVPKAVVNGGGADMDFYTIAITGGPTIKIPAGSYPFPNNYVRNVELSAYPKLVGNVKVVFTVEDIRGRTKSFTRTITIVPYTQLALVNNNTHRRGGIGREVILDFEGRWHGSPLTISCTGIVAKEAGSSATHASLTPTLTTSGQTFSYNSEWNGVTFASDTAYNITATFTDGIITISVVLPIPVGTPVISVRDKKVGINNPNPSCELDVDGVIKGKYTRVFDMIGGIPNADVHNCTEVGFYLSFSANLTNAPISRPAPNCLVQVMGNSTASLLAVIFYDLEENDMYVCSRFANTWSAWKKVTLT